ncbi:MAG TPA: alpha/beta hydrolase [Acidimicrobiales bacterium]|nr:alpha/beta hydrolase [Acidimicrobiales bacterium]
MARDPELASFLDEPFPNDLDDIAGTRRILAARRDEEIADRVESPGGPRWWDEVIAGPDGTSLTLRIYVDDSEPGPHGALLFFHGGAFVFGDLESEHNRCRHLARGSGCIVVSVDYRLAPENPFPAALDDATTALEWLFEHADSLGVDPARMGIGGASAGGAVASVTALRARDEGGPGLRAQFLIYPAVDDRASEGSIEQYMHSEPWDGERTQKMWPLYLSTPSGEESRYASPMRSEDLSGLPVTYLLVAEEDPLRDEALNFAQRLLNAGVSVNLRLIAGAFHGFDVVAPNARLSEFALDEQREFVVRELGRDEGRWARRANVHSISPEALSK